MSLNRKRVVRSADSPSLWNCTLAPGWTKEETGVLRLAIMRFGLGAWSKIIRANCLPGKNPSQLNLQTQRMMGQQSLGEFMGINLDPKSVWEENHKKQGPEYVRKNGCLINTGNNPNREARIKKIEENRKKYGITKAEAEKIILPVKEAIKDPITIRLEKKTKLRRLKDILNYMQDRLFRLEQLNGTVGDYYQKSLSRWQLYESSSSNNNKKKNGASSPKKRNRKAKDDFIDDDIEVEDLSDDVVYVPLERAKRERKAVKPVTVSSDNEFADDEEDNDNKKKRGSQSDDDSDDFDDLAEDEESEDDDFDTEEPSLKKKKQ